MRFQTQSAPSQATNYAYDWHLSDAEIANALIKLQAFCMSNLPAQFGMSSTLEKSDQDGKLLLIFTGAWYGPENDFAAVVHPFLSQMVSPKFRKLHIYIRDFMSK
jgi:hypothetical protein